MTRRRSTRTNSVHPRVDQGRRWPLPPLPLPLQLSRPNMDGHHRRLEDHLLHQSLPLTVRLTPRGTHLDPLPHPLRQPTKSLPLATIPPPRTLPPLVHPMDPTSTKGPPPHPPSSPSSQAPLTPPDLLDHHLLLQPPTQLSEDHHLAHPK